MGDAGVVGVSPVCVTVTVVVSFIVTCDVTVVGDVMVESCVIVVTVPLAMKNVAIFDTINNTTRIMIMINEDRSISYISPYAYFIY